MYHAALNDIYSPAKNTAIKLEFEDRTDNLTTQEPHLIQVTKVMSSIIPLFD